MKATLLAIWKAKYVLIIGIALVAGWLLVTQWLDYRDEARQISLPVRAVQTKAAARWKSQVVPGCPAVVELLPAPKELKRLERDFGIALAPGVVDDFGPPARSVVRPGDETAPAVSDTVPEGSGVLGHSTAPHVLGVFEVPKMPYGGEALATLPDSGRLDLRFKAEAPPFVGFRPVWGFGGLVDPTKPSESWRAYLLLEPLHFRGRWHARLTAGPELRNGKTDLVLGVGAEFRSR